MKPIDLHAAADRLREDPPPGFPRRVGRPRTRPVSTAEAPNGATSTSLESPAPGTLRAQSPSRTRRNSGRGADALARQASALPRLLDVHGAAAYLSVSTWTLRQLVSRGVLRRVLIPVANGRDLRKVLLDREDLDRLVEAWKEQAP